MQKNPLLVRRILSVAIAIVLGTVITSQAQTYTNGSGTFYYGITNSAITITQFQGMVGSNLPVIIPDSIDSLPVIAIGSDAFAGQYGSVFNVTIPNSVTSIGQYAFAYCTGLTNVLVGYGAKNIGAFAFHGCSGLRSIYYLGNAPTYSTNIFDYGATNYYLPTATGWSNLAGGIPATPWYPLIPSLGIITYSNHPVLVFQAPAAFPTSVGTNYVLQMTTNLASTNWVTVTNGIPFISFQITNALSPSFFRLQPL